MILKHVAIAALFYTAIAAWAQQVPPTVVSWSTATATRPSDGYVIVYRFAEDFASDFDKASQPDRVTITWKYAGGRGMPFVPERQQMDTFEDTLDRALGGREFATLALVRTGNDVRQRVYYTKSAEVFKFRMTAALSSTQLAGVDIEHAEDRTWSLHEQFRRSLKRP